MNKYIAHKCALSLQDNLSFVDKITGIVKVGVVKKGGIEQTFPIAVNAGDFEDEEDDRRVVYDEFIPDNKKKSVIYFEDLGAVAVEQHNKWLVFEGVIKLVCWINYERTKPDLHDTTYFVAEVIKQLPTKFSRYKCFNAIFCHFRNQDIRDGSVFAKYSYNDMQSQYWTYPYDYFSLNFTTTYRVHEDCFNFSEL